MTAAWKGYYYSTVLALILILRALFNSVGIVQLNFAGIRITNYMNVVVASKISSMPLSACRHIDMGKIVNLVTTDARQVLSCIMTLD